MSSPAIDIRRVSEMQAFLFTCAWIFGWTSICILSGCSHWPALASLLPQKEAKTGAFTKVISITVRF